MSLIAIQVPPRPSVVVNSTGAGNRNTSNNNYTLTTNFSHTVVDGGNRRMYALIAVSHSNWLNSYSTNPSATSSIDGAFTIISGPVFFGNSSGYRQGSITLLELINPSVGVHTITLACSATQWLGAVGGNTRCYNNVSGYSTPITQAHLGTADILNISLSPAAREMAFVAGAFNSSPVFTAGTPDRWHNVGSSIFGDADYIIGMDAAGPGNYTFSTSSNHKLGAIGLNLLPT